MARKGPKPDTKADARIKKLKDTYGWSFRRIAEKEGRNVRTIYDRYCRAKAMEQLSTLKR